MGWGLVRITIFTIAFFFGTMVVGPRGSAAGSKSFNTPHLNESIGTSLVVTCAAGDVVIKRLSGQAGTVRLECARSKIVVARDRHTKATSYYHLLGM